MTTRPRILDAMCHKGGAAMGYHRAGFDVVGVDIEDTSADYPFTFVQGDALEYILDCGHEFDAIHASPPCQDRIAITAGNRKRPDWKDNHVNLVPSTRAALAAVRAKTGIPTVMECGVGRHLRRDLWLCGDMFFDQDEGGARRYRLAVQRHRWFEVDGITVPQPAHEPHRGRVAGMRHGEWFTGPYFAVYGDGGGKGSISEWQAAMGIDWIHDRRGLAEAIPPAYTEYVGRRLMGRILTNADPLPMLVPLF